VAVNPCLIAEIASPDSARVDRREKVAAYRRINSLREYLVIEQAHRRVERHWRAPPGAWQTDELVGDGTMSIACPETTLTLDELYEGLAPLTVKEMEAIGYAVG
jgi:Uma2 family endonuclease